MKKIFVICKAVLIRNIIAAAGTVCVGAAAFVLFSSGYVCELSENAVMKVAKRTAKQESVAVMSGNVTQENTIVMQSCTEPIAFEKKTEENPQMYVGESSIVQQGADGEKNVQIKVTMHNDTELLREIVSEEITKQPVAEVMAVGIKPVPTGKGTGSFLFPTTGTISSHFGERWGKMHKGLDIANNLGTDIYASDEGKVTFAGEQTGYGNVIILDHGNGYVTKYAHCSELLKNEGDIVGKGDIIAKSGNTGRSTGNHVHFEIVKDGEAVNPLDFVVQT